MRKWANGAPANFLHMQLLLEAELMTVNKKASPDTITELYKKGIEAASKQDYINDVALGCELLAEYKSRCLGVTPEAREYYTRAAVLYERWGAKVKSQKLRDRLRS